MAKKTETVETTEVQETDGWVLVRALMRLQGHEGREVEIGEEYLQPPEAAAFMAAHGWVEIVAAPVAPVEVKATDEWPA